MTSTGKLKSDESAMLGTDIPLYMIHGYNHDPDSPEHAPTRPGGIFDVWNRLFETRNRVPFLWYSAIQWRDTAKAVAEGYSNTYAWSYDVLARQAGDNLVATVRARGVAADIVAHSLGTRVALLAIAKAPARTFRRVLFLNGAETVETAKSAIRMRSEVRYLNIVVRADSVLKYMGARFEPKWGRHGCIGNGMPVIYRRLPQFDEIVLDDIDDQEFFRDSHCWDLQGNGPGWGDHSYSFEREENWPLYRAWAAEEM